ncbi:hypothetical protein CPT_Moabite_043 [Serratia phage Moabite]|uniref:Uncharacterized protein n=1 Tax=Serratia phage Moabite TaxID=2587814 RepID=A0A4Y5TNX7_9CAUD|nr:hypothetical protein HWC48_gp043 [Serratia phage Moabite]QDB71075.1 hypothetical protein CPT_Moabite_043 [Serratia phage Moabite]UGO54260.1 hypothetical protein HAYMO_278 [Serratia phage vB_SmaM_Haymo]
MATVHASLNGYGYTKDPTIIADELFGESIYSRRSQTEIYFGKIVSLDDMIRQFSDRPTELCKELEDQYTELFGRHFVDVRVQATSEEPEGKDAFNVVLKIRYLRDGIRYDFARVIEHYDGVVKEITRILDK